jgi:hypothetical protein
MLAELKHVQYLRAQEVTKLVMVDTNMNRSSRLGGGCKAVAVVWVETTRGVDARLWLLSEWRQLGGWMHDAAYDTSVNAKWGKNF